MECALVTKHIKIHVPWFDVSFFSIVYIKRIIFCLYICETQLLSINRKFDEKAFLVKRESKESVKPSLKIHLSKLNRTVRIEEIDWMYTSLFSLVQGVFQIQIYKQLNISLFLCISRSRFFVVFSVSQFFTYLIIDVDFTSGYKLSHFSFKLLLFIMFLLNSLPSIKPTSQISMNKCFPTRNTNVFSYL